MLSGSLEKIAALHGEKPVEGSPSAGAAAHDSTSDEKPVATKAKTPAAKAPKPKASSKPKKKAAASRGRQADASEDKPRHKQGRSKAYGISMKTGLYELAQEVSDATGIPISKLVETALVERFKVLGHISDS
ncbi:MAG: ribbon-helix-helix domain-containing protein [Bradymonadia bacterium]